jgi:guanyl-specific ribonuclease Sa
MLAALAVRTASFTPTAAKIASRALATASFSAAASSVDMASCAARAPAKASATLDTLNVDNLAIRKLPIDKELRNFVRPSVPNACFSKVTFDALLRYCANTARW